VSQALEVLGVNSRSFPRQSSYLSPEELSGKTPSAQSEIFSLGIIFYELLTGKRPFGGRTTTMVMATVLTDDITSSTESADDDADRIVAAILRALEKDPADRWNSAAQFAAALRGEAATKQPTKFSSPERGCLPTIVLLSGSAAAVHYLLI
jgi:serine/threonine-protein kinase